MYEQTSEPIRDISLGKFRIEPSYSFVELYTQKWLSFNESVSKNFTIFTQSCASTILISRFRTSSCLWYLSWKIPPSVGAALPNLPHLQVRDLHRNGGLNTGAQSVQNQLGHEEKSVELVGEPLNLLVMYH
jgi:hypothetical protein